MALPPPDQQLCTLNQSPESQQCDGLCLLCIVARVDLAILQGTFHNKVDGKNSRDVENCKRNRILGTSIVLYEQLSPSPTLTNPSLSIQLLVWYELSLSLSHYGLLSLSAASLV